MICLDLRKQILILYLNYKIFKLLEKAIIAHGFIF